MADLFVNKCTVLLAAGLARDALVEVNAAVARIEREHGSATRRAELVYSSALAAAATGDFGLAQERSDEALRLFRRQQRPWWAARAELTLLLCRFGEDQDSAAALLPAARRVTARLDAMDSRGPIDAHLLTGRIALAAGRRDEAARHLRTAADARHRGQLRTRSVGWLAQATWCRGRAALAGHAGRLRPRAGPARPAPADARRHRAAHPGHRQRRASSRTWRCGTRSAGSDARLFLEWSERWRGTVLRVTPVRPSADSDLVADLAALRNVAARLDSALDSRAAAPALERERRRLETAVRQRVLRTPAVARRPGRVLPHRRPARPAGRHRPARADRRRRAAARRRGHRRPAAPGARRPDPGGGPRAGPRAVRAAPRGRRPRQPPARPGRDRPPPGGEPARRLGPAAGRRAAGRGADRETARGALGDAALAAGTGHRRHAVGVRVAARPARRPPGGRPGRAGRRPPAAHRRRRGPGTWSGATRTPWCWPTATPPPTG